MGRTREEMREERRGDKIRYEDEEIFFFFFLQVGLVFFGYFLRRGLIKGHNVY